MSSGLPGGRPWMRAWIARYGSDWLPSRMMGSIAGNGSKAMSPVPSSAWPPGIASSGQHGPDASALWPGWPPQAASKKPSSGAPRTARTCDMPRLLHDQRGAAIAAIGPAVAQAGVTIRDHLEPRLLDPGRHQGIAHRFRALLPECQVAFVAAARVGMALDDHVHVLAGREPSHVLRQRARIDPVAAEREEHLVVNRPGPDRSGGASRRPRLGGRRRGNVGGPGLGPRRLDLGRRGGDA